MTQDPQHLFDVEIEDGVLIVTPQGDAGSLIDLNLQKEWQQIMENADGSTSRVLIDLTHMNYFGSVVLEWMIAAWKKVDEREQGAMAVCNVSPVAREILGIAKFDSLWPIYESRAEGVAALKLP